MPVPNIAAASPRSLSNAPSARQSSAPAVKKSLTKIIDRRPSGPAVNCLSPPASPIGHAMLLDSIDSLQAALTTQTYIADRGLATSLFLALKLQRPLLLEGEPGVGKTEVAKVIANLLDTELIRL